MSSNIEDLERRIRELEDPIRFENKSLKTYIQVRLFYYSVAIFGTIALLFGVGTTFVIQTLVENVAENKVTELSARRVANEIARVEEFQRAVNDSVLAELDGAVVGFASAEGETCPAGWQPYTQAIGRFLLGAGATNDTDSNGNPLIGHNGTGETGGAVSFLLTEDNLPAHDHEYDRPELQERNVVVDTSPAGGSDDARYAATFSILGDAPVNETKTFATESVDVVRADDSFKGEDTDEYDNPEELTIPLTSPYVSVRFCIRQSSG